MQETVRSPALLVSTTPQLVLAILESPSSALALATATLFKGIGLGVTTGANVGGVVSRLMVTVWLDVPPKLVAWKIKLMPLVSKVRVVGLQLSWLLTLLSLSTTVQIMLTSLVCQPLLPRLPVMTGAITGAVLSLISKVKLFEAAKSLASTAVAVSWKLPIAVGVPESVSVTKLRLIGKLPVRVNTGEGEI